jgi:hypothetical protein
MTKVHNSPIQRNQVLKVMTMLKLKYLQNRSAKTLLYRDSYLEMGFLWLGDEFWPSPKCIVVKYYKTKRWSPVN